MSENIEEVTNARSQEVDTTKSNEPPIFDLIEREGVVDTDIIVEMSENLPSPEPASVDESEDMPNSSSPINVSVNSRSPTKREAKSARDKFERNGKTLLKLAKKLKEDTKCNLYLKAQLKCANGTKTILEGRNFSIIGLEQSPPKPVLTLEDVSKVVSESVKATVRPMLDSIQEQSKRPDSN
ncbi:unnamed protein product, partial [Allacma fusca]